MLLGQVPLIQDIREAGDQGVPALSEHEQLRNNYANSNIRRQVAYRNAYFDPTILLELKDKVYINISKPQ